MTKYVVVLCDGMADLPSPALGGETPMHRAKKPNMDYLAKHGEYGRVKTVPDNLSPGSDVANLSVMGYDPAVYYSGRSPLEAVSMGIDMLPTDVSLRCNLVTLSDEPRYEDKTMVDYCADDISTKEAALLIQTVEEKLGSDIFKFYAGISYRHCLIWANGTTEIGTMTPPHDISGRVIGDYLNKSEAAAPFIDLMKRSEAVLRDHPVNLARIARGKRPATSIWLWGQGVKPRLDSFEKLYGVRGAVVSAVDLIKGIGICAGLEVCEVEGATGYIDTNFKGKTAAALRQLEDGKDFVYMHFEAPDECGHRGEVENKVRSIEIIDEEVLAVLREELEKYDNYRLLILPDHPTPLTTMTHSREPVPYILYDRASDKASGGGKGEAKDAQGANEATGETFCADENSAYESGLFEQEGHKLMAKLISAKD
jgi:2,3-bisphosphoglycerate-independent phosphoglycerate mutase